MTKLGGIQTGVVSSFKREATDASKLTADQDAKDQQEAEKVLAAPPAVGKIIYHTRGVTVFNCFTAQGLAINFVGGIYIVDKDDPVAEDITKALDYFVAKKILEKKEG